MKKPAAIFITALIAAQPFAASADEAAGPIELNEMGLDAVTAGSISVPPSAAVNVLSDATGDFAMTSTSSGTFIKHTPVSLMFGYAPVWVTAQRGTATATSTGATADQSTSIATTPEVATAAAINPYAATINWTRKILGTEISAFAQVAPGGPLLDFSITDVATFADRNDGQPLSGRDSEDDRFNTGQRRSKGVRGSNGFT